MVTKKCNAKSPNLAIMLNVIMQSAIMLIVFFLVYAGSGSGQSVLIWTDPEHRESKETVLCPLGWI